MTVASATSPLAFDLNAAIEHVRSPDGAVLVASAGIGILMAAHWPLLVLVMAPFFLSTLLVPRTGRHGSMWLGIAAVWAVAVVIRRNAMEDHVYLYIAWLVAVGTALVEPNDFLREVQLTGRRLVAVVFGFATLWKLLSGTFLNGATLWTIGLIDDRLEPMMRTAAISQDSFDSARPEVVALLNGDRSSFEIELSSYSSLALVAISLGTVALEATIAMAYLAGDDSRLASLRAPLLVLFGIATYAVVPVLPFALLLSLIGIVVARFDRRVIIGFSVMLVVTVVRFLTL